MDGAPDVIGEIGLRVQGTLHPEAFLAERRRQYEAAVRFRDPVEQGDRWCAPLLLFGWKMGGEVRECGVFEDEVERYVGAEGLAQPVSEP
ncbi:hypothetical protein AB0G71_31380, partial [Streptomyces sp. NPDC020403]|uniref:hypothetical protein n=1 Tax=Streptomyces sp. NPDC020403 TaxID=3154487 RepID=UPI0033D2E9BB